MSDNPFATEKAWDVMDGSILSHGDYVCTISVDEGGDANSSGGHPQVVLQLTDDAGAGFITDWIVVIPSTIGKWVQLTDAAGIERPGDDEVTPEGTGYRFKASYLKKVDGKKVGVIVRQEPNRQDPTKPPKDRVKGYVPADQIVPTGASDVTTTADNNAFASAQADDKIPF
jgi:hypothetical protein